MRRLRLVLDSNVIISAVFFGGPPEQLVLAALEGRVETFVSMAILDEILGVVQRPKFGLNPDQALQLIEELHALCRVVVPSMKVQAIPADPDDNAVLECAMEARADIVVSGDDHLLALGNWQGLRILGPSEALRFIQPTDGRIRD